VSGRGDRHQRARTPNCAERPVVGAVSTTWVADDPTWSVLLQRDAVRKAGDALAVNTQDLLTYHHSGLEVVGRSDPVPVTVEFHRIPPYHCYGLPPEDYPRVFADPGARPPHRMPEDERLCLWAPFDPPEQRWTAPDGLQRLLDITAVHLFAEEYWRHTGGVDEDGVEIGTWPIPQAAHGAPAPAATSRARTRPRTAMPGVSRRVRRRQMKSTLT